jgi:hypothetical protein
MDGRLAILSSVDDHMAATEALRLGLEQAVAELGGVGGLVLCICTLRKACTWPRAAACPRR